MSTGKSPFPNLLTGTWKLLPGESDFAFLPPPSYRLDTIVHDEPRIHIRTHQLDSNGDNTVDRDLVIGGEPVEISLLGRPRLISARWDNGELLVQTRSTVSGQQRLLEDRWALEANPDPALTRLVVTRVHHLPGGAVRQTLRFRPHAPETPLPAQAYNGD